MADYLRLGVNIDHVATLRNARGGGHPDTARAAKVVAQAGADGLTIHLREDRRHIRDEDVQTIAERGLLPLNLEMAATAEMLDIALKARPNAVCIVPEKREEITTEGGLNVRDDLTLTNIINPLKKLGIRVSLFIDPDPVQIQTSAKYGADIVELHTGPYANSASENRGTELNRLRSGAAFAAECGLEVHAGHGLTFDNVGSIAAIAEIVELNIGHFLVGEALFMGLGPAVTEMRRRMDQGRAHVLQN